MSVYQIFVAFYKNFASYIKTNTYESKKIRFDCHPKF